MSRTLLVFSHKLRSVALLATVSALGTSSPAVAFETTLEGLCHDIHSSASASASAGQAGANGSTLNKSLSFATRVKLRFSPKSFIGIRSNQAEIPQDSSSYPTLIFSMKPEIDSIPDNLTLLQDVREDYVDSLPTQRDLRALINAKDETACLNKARELEISSQQLEAYARILDRNELYMAEFQANENQRIAQAAATRFQDGHVFAATTTQEILKRIASLSGTQHNFVFVFHADPTGRLYDYSRMIVEQDFFKKIKSKAHTIAIYSCHPDAVFRYYSPVISDYKRSSIPVFQPDLKRDFKSIDAAPWGLLEEFARQEQVLLQTGAPN